MCSPPPPRPPPPPPPPPGFQVWSVMEEQKGLSTISRPYSCLHSLFHLLIYLSIYLCIILPVYSFFTFYQFLFFCFFFCIIVLFSSICLFPPLSLFLPSLYLSIYLCILLSICSSFTFLSLVFPFINFSLFSFSFLRLISQCLSMTQTIFSLHCVFGDRLFPQFYLVIDHFFSPSLY